MNVHFSRLRALFASLLFTSATGAFAVGEPAVIINELDSDTPGTDALEFIELYAAGGTLALDGYVLVFYNGSNDLSYLALDLDSFSTDANGYFVAGNAGVAGVDLTFGGNVLQNGQDAVALYLGDASAFPTNTPVTTSNLVDAIVYDTDDADDPGLLPLLNAGQPQVNENANAALMTESNQRCPNGAGGARNTATYLQAVPTPGVSNNCPGAIILSINDLALTEGDGGTTNFQFTVSLTSPAEVGGVEFDIATADGTAQDDDPGTEDEDYVANSLLDQVIPEGQSSFQFTVVVNGDAEVEPNETFFVNVTSVTGATAGDTQGQGTIQNDDVTVIRIHDVQGSGAASPEEDETVTVRGIVTGVRTTGFFVQEEEADYDADPATSEGILVYTGTAPPAAAAVGNLVQVTGIVDEFVPAQDPLQPPMTELTSPTVAQISTGNPLPAPIPLTATFPDPAGPHDQLERVEGMRVSVASLTVVGPTLGNTSEPNATATTTGVFYGVVTGVARPFREAGIPAPDPAPSGGGSIPPIPRFDSNPERIRVDSDSLVGATAINAGAGAVVSNLVGPLDYTFRTYSISPDPGSASVDGAPTPTAVATPTGAEFTVASYNMERFFDDLDDGDISEPVLTATAYANRLKKASLQIRDYLKTPDIVGVIEVENLDTLFDLVGQITADAIADGDPDPDYLPYLTEGNDVGGIDVSFLVKKQLVDNKVSRIQVLSVTQENAGELFVNPDASTSLLNDRPPLVLDAIVHHESGESFPIVVIVNHLRSLNGANSEETGSNGWSTDGARVRAKRQKQAESLANLVQARQIADPAEHLIVLGDFNFFEVNDGLTHGMGVVTGAPVPDNETAVPGDGIDLVNPNLTRLEDATATERYSFIFDGNAQSLDHLLVSAPLVAATTARRVEHPRINADYPATDRSDYSAGNPRRLADHDPLVAFFSVEAFATTIFVDGFESQGTERWSSTQP